MAKIKATYICSNCGTSFPKWSGQCSSCGEWNTLNEELIDPGSKTATKRVITSKPMTISEIDNQYETRYKTGLKELDRVLGGGIVKGSLVLLGGDPGIGKSTILLQVSNHVSAKLKVLYVSGEESIHQLKLRATRLGIQNENLFVLAETDIEIIKEHIQTEMPNLIIIDSIQTMNHSELSSSVGSIVQVRECTNFLMRIAKTFGIPIILVGHVNKDGGIAGPKVLEHIVDTVLYFEGDQQNSYRILRSIKNRYGSTNEIGVFEMHDKGLKEVLNPSEFLLSCRPKNVSGTCVACVMEGTRPILTEIQGLVTPSGFGNPRRMSTGFDYNRMALLLAVLEKRAGFFFSNLDVYLNVVGGLKLFDPSADLSVATALVSSLKDKTIDDFTILFGEIGLSGEIRSVSNAIERTKEAARLGFKTCIIPYHNIRSFPQDILLTLKNTGLNILGAKNIKEALNLAGL